MPVAQVTVVFRQFDYKGSTPYRDIPEGSAVRYSPKPLEEYDGRVLFKSVVTTNYDNIPNLSTGKIYYRRDIEIIFRLLLQVPIHTKITPRIFATYPLNLLRLPHLDAIYPSFTDFYNYPRTRTMQDFRLWIDGWSWWYHSRELREREEV
jgi:hypothetical protein